MKARTSPPKLCYTVAESQVTPGHYFVDKDGKVSRALFMGNGARQAAQEYADWKNGVPSKLPEHPESLEYN